MRACELQTGAWESYDQVFFVIDALATSPDIPKQVSFFTKVYSLDNSIRLLCHSLLAL